MKFGPYDLNNERLVGVTFSFGGSDNLSSNVNTNMFSLNNVPSFDISGVIQQEAKAFAELVGKSTKPSIYNWEAAWAYTMEMQGIGLYRPRYEDIDLMPPEPIYEPYTQSPDRSDISTVLFQPTALPRTVVPFSPINSNFSPIVPELPTAETNSAAPIGIPQFPLPLTSTQTPSQSSALQASTYEPTLAPDLYSSFMGHSDQPLIFSQPMGLISSNAFKLSQEPAEPKEPSAKQPITKNTEPKNTEPKNPQPTKPTEISSQKSVAPEKIDAQTWLKEFGGSVTASNLVGSDSDIIEKFEIHAPQPGGVEEPEVVELLRDETPYRRSDGSIFHMLIPAAEASTGGYRDDRLDEQDTKSRKSDSFLDLSSLYSDELFEMARQDSIARLHNTEEFAIGVGLGLLYSLNDGIEGIKQGVKEGNRKFWAGEDWELTKLVKKLPSVLNPETWQPLRKEISDVADYIEDDISRLQRRETTKLASFFDEVYTTFKELPPRQQGEVIGRGLFFIAPNYTVVKPFMAATNLAGTIAEVGISYSTIRIPAFFDTYAIRSPITFSFQPGKLYSFPGQLDVFNFQSPLIRKMAEHELPIYQAKFKGELIGQYSQQVYWNGINPPIPPEHAKNFYGWHIESYRLFDSLDVGRGGIAGRPYSNWHSITDPYSEIGIRINSAVCNLWYEKNKITGASIIDTIWHGRIREGGIIHIGIAAPQGGIFLGGHTQIYLINPRDIEILSSRTLEGDSLWNQIAEHEARKLYKY